MKDDPYASFKAAQREGWALFAPLEALTTLPAATLVSFAGATAGLQVLDVACGTGVVAVTAAQRGARVAGLDLAPALLARARANAELAGVAVEFREGDVEALPYGDEEFDLVLSQFGHMFGPRPAVTVSEMLRVLKPGGYVAFSTWPPEMLMGQIFTLINRYLPPPPGVPPTSEWGRDDVIRERLGDAVTDLRFERGLMLAPALSTAHYRRTFETTAAPLVKLVAALRDETARLTQFRAELDSLIDCYRDGNAIRHHFLMTRARKR